MTVNLGVLKHRPANGENTGFLFLEWGLLRRHLILSNVLRLLSVHTKQGKLSVPSLRSISGAEKPARASLISSRQLTQMHSATEEGGDKVKRGVRKMSESVTGGVVRRSRTVVTVHQGFCVTHSSSSPFFRHPSLGAKTSSALVMSELECESVSLCDHNVLQHTTRGAAVY